MHLLIIVLLGVIEFQTALEIIVTKYSTYSSVERQYMHLGTNLDTSITINMLFNNKSRN